MIEETEQDVYVTPNGSVYYLEDMAPICDFYEKHKDESPVERGLEASGL